MIVIGFRAQPKWRWFRFKIFILIISAKKFISKRSHSEILGTQIFRGPKFILQQDLLLPESFLKMIILYLNNYFKNFLCLQSLSHVWLFATPWTAARQASLSITNSRSLLKLLFIESLMPSSHLILCCPLFLLPSIFPSIRVFSNESVLWIRWVRVLELQLQHHSFQWIFWVYFL